MNKKTGASTKSTTAASTAKATPAKRPATKAKVNVSRLTKPTSSTQAKTNTNRKFATGNMIAAKARQANKTNQTDKGKATAAAKPIKEEPSKQQDEDEEEEETKFSSDVETDELLSEEEDDYETILLKQRVDLVKFNTKLAAQGLKMQFVGADGNCFFRAVADQLYGKEFFHMRLRAEVIDHLKKNRDEYKFFMENDMSIDRYIILMAKDGAWGGQLEMSILAKLHTFNIVVHQVDHPTMVQEFHSWDTPGLKTLHMTYHRGRHYNSVRKLADPGTEPAIKFPIEHALIKKQPAEGEVEIQMPEVTLVEHACLLLEVEDQSIMEEALEEYYPRGLKSLTKEVITSDISLIRTTYHKARINAALKDFMNIASVYTSAAGHRRTTNDENEEMKEEVAVVV